MELTLAVNNMYRIAVLASTRGTDLQAIIDEMEAGLMPGIEILRVVSNVEDCGALEKARSHGIEDAFVDPKDENFNKNLIDAVGDVDLVCLIGFMRILDDDFIKRYKGRIINVHPSLLPKYGGKGFYGDMVHVSALESGDSESGMSIHFVDEGVDTGPVFLQKKVAIEDNETVDSLKAKVQALEKKWYPEAIRILAKQRNDEEI